MRTELLATKIQLHDLERAVSNYINWKNDPDSFLGEPIAMLQGEVLRARLLLKKGWEFEFDPPESYSDENIAKLELDYENSFRMLK